MKKKHAMTLLEIMIVIFLIGLIGSVVGVNMKKSLDEGKYFKSTQAAERICDILQLEAATQNITLKEAVDHVDAIVQNSGLVKDANKALKDGWGNRFEIKVGDNDELIISTQKIQDYEAKKLHFN